MYLFVLVGQLEILVQLIFLGLRSLQYFDLHVAGSLGALREAVSGSRCWTTVPIV